MVRNAQDLEATFKLVGIARQGNPTYANDDGYWTGGTCNWGANHNLQEDCRTLANGLNKAESLNGKAITDALTKCTSKQEFESNKSTLLRKADEVLSQLKVRAGPSSSMFGICIIWADEANSKLVETELNNGRSEIANAKKLIENTNYDWAEDLKRVQLEINKIEARMEENRRKAAKETDPISRAKIIAEIEEDGKLLQTKYEERNRYTDKFKHIDPSKHVSRMIERMKQAIERSRGSKGNNSGGGSNRPPKKPNKPNENGDSGNGRSGEGDPDDNTNPRTPRKRGQEKKDKDNQQMILIAITVALVFFFLMNQKDKPSRRDYKEFDYY